MVGGSGYRRVCAAQASAHAWHRRGWRAMSVHTPSRYSHLPHSWHATRTDRMPCTHAPAPKRQDAHTKTRRRVRGPSWCGSAPCMAGQQRPEPARPTAPPRCIDRRSPTRPALAWGRQAAQAQRAPCTALRAAKCGGVALTVAKPCCGQVGPCGLSGRPRACAKKVRESRSSWPKL